MKKSALTLQAIRSEADYRAALKRAGMFFDADEEPEPDSDEGAFFEAPITLIEAYERKHCPIALPDRSGCLSPFARVHRGAKAEQGPA